MLNSWRVAGFVSILIAANNANARTSATNAARVYNTCLSEPENQPDGWFSFDLRTEQVWDGFCLLALLEDYALRHAVLTLPHDGHQKGRFTDAMAARNLRIQQAGQEEYAHVCKKCVRVWVDDDGTPNRKSPSSGEAIFTDDDSQRSVACLLLTASQLDTLAVGHCTAPCLSPTTAIGTVQNMMGTTTSVQWRAAFYQWQPDLRLKTLFA
jgi:hypothetical protein